MLQSCSRGLPNSQGLIVKEWADRYNLHPVSISEISSGPGYTYFSGEKRTTVDYIFSDVATVECLETCYTHDMHGFNTSDHLPISATLSLPTTQSCDQHQSCVQPQINWDKIPNNVLQSYQNLIHLAVSNSLGKHY